MEELYFLEYAAPTSPLRAGIPNLGISLRKTIQQNESWHHGWVREADRLPIQHWLDRGETVQLMPLRFCARFPGTDSWGNRAVWRNGRAAWWVRNNGNKRKREPVIRDHATEDEDEEERREAGSEVMDYSTTEDEDEEEGRKLKREAKEESVKVKQEPISPPPLRR